MFITKTAGFTSFFRRHSSSTQLKDPKPKQQTAPNEEIVQFIRKIISISKKLDQRSEQKKRAEDEEIDRLCREATEACLRAIITHLYTFIQDCDNWDALYEDWLHEVHPENCDGLAVDHRFYIEESDHRLIWNELMERRNQISKVVRPQSVQRLRSSLQKSVLELVERDEWDLAALRNSFAADE
mmetsp:Transcript_9744/g.14648  ORF Transcript_9744/g.14648 Transcript_9744/m.14648 type:complete len:184 (+) Transcript_9744:160-711(+)